MLNSCYPNYYEENVIRILFRAQILFFCQMFVFLRRYLYAYRLSCSRPPFLWFIRKNRRVVELICLLMLKHFVSGAVYGTFKVGE